MSRDVAWIRRLLAWLEGGLSTGRVERLGLRSTPLKLLRFHDAPAPGLTTVTTFERSERRWPGPGLQVGHELAFTARGPVDALTVLRRAAETLDALGRPPQPGLVLTDLLQGIDGVAVGLPHALVLPAWAFDLEPLQEGDRRVELLALVPVSDAEVATLRHQGLDALHARWVAADTDLLQPGRPSAV